MIKSGKHRGSAPALMNSPGAAMSRDHNRLFRFIYKDRRKHKTSAVICYGLYRTIPASEVRQVFSSDRLNLTQLSPGTPEKTGSQTQRLSPKTLKALELAVIQIGIETAVREKGFVGTLLDDRAVVHYKNNVRVADS